MSDTYGSLPKFDLISKLSNIPNFEAVDIDNNLLPQIDFKYYTINNFNTQVTTDLKSSHDTFSVLHCNVRSLSANFDSLITMLSEVQIYILGISETKLIVNKDPIINIEIPNYHFVSQPSSQIAGGVGFYVGLDLEFHSRQDLSITTEDFECLWIEIHCTNQTNTICSVIYRHPSCNLENFTDYLTSCIDKVSNEKKNCIIMGDFNINLLNFESHSPTEEFFNTMTSYFFQPHIIQPTRITDHSATLIDNIYLNTIEYKTISGNLIYDISDHLPNFIVISKLSQSSYNYDRYIRDYSQFNEADFLEEVGTIDWMDVFGDTDDVNLIFSSFFYTLSVLVDKHVPLKKLSKRKAKLLSKPWITKGIRVSIKRKNKFYKLYLK